MARAAVFQIFPCSVLPYPIPITPVLFTFLFYFCWHNYSLVVEIQYWYLDSFCWFLHQALDLVVIRREMIGSRRPHWNEPLYCVVLWQLLYFRRSWNERNESGRWILVSSLLHGLFMVRFTLFLFFSSSVETSIPIHLSLLSSYLFLFLCFNGREQLKESFINNFESKKWRWREKGRGSSSFND